MIKVKVQGSIGVRGLGLSFPGKGGSNRKCNYTTLLKLLTLPILIDGHSQITITTRFSKIQSKALQLRLLWWILLSSVDLLELMMSQTQDILTSCLFICWWSLSSLFSV